MKKKVWIISIIILIVLGSIAIVFFLPSKLPAQMPSQTDYSKDIDINSPEGLAKYSSDIYKDMIARELDVNEVYNKLLEISSENSKTEMQKYKSKFMDSIKDLISYFKEDEITQVEFAQTGLKKDQASIKRIQIHKSGKKYYFQQDYIKEKGVWKICGDNIDNAFRIKTQILFWYF